mmetsp:Transcript_19047/g.51783  ORF Transcript_19047/g.51783 Transcript_19047/m.51783 type:complete len:112 (-) Transcript_19047:285-620(-)
MYPWVCDTDSSGNTYQYYWGPTLMPFGDDTHRVKCYYDNEPADNHHWGSTEMPPVWKAYKFYFDSGSQQLKGWLLAEYVNPSGDPAVTPVTHYGDPAYEFSLTGQGYSPPW